MWKWAVRPGPVASISARGLIRGPTFGVGFVGLDEPKVAWLRSWPVALPCGLSQICTGSQFAVVESRPFGVELHVSAFSLIEVFQTRWDSLGSE